MKATIEQLRALHTHLREGSPYSLLFSQAAELTSKADTELNQQMKHLRMSGLYHALLDTLRRGVAGDVAECGCFRGQSAYIISRMLSDHKFTGRFCVFDSFQGLSEFTEADKSPGRSNSDTIKTIQNRFISSEDDVRHLLSPFKFVDIYPGWIPSRFSEIRDRCFAFIHLDVDLYQPTLDALEFFWPRLGVGGVVIVDDYNWAMFPGASKAVDEIVTRFSPSLFLPLPAGGSLLLRAADWSAK